MRLKLLALAWGFKRWDWLAGPLALVSIMVQGWGWAFEAWAIGTVAQAPWWILILQKRTWGLLPMQTGFTIVTLWNLYKYWPR